MEKLYVKIDGKFTEHENTVEMKKALHLDKMIKSQKGIDMQVLEENQLSDEDKLILGLITEAEITQKAQEQAIIKLSSKCQTERIKILDDTKIMNVLTGATEGYPEYLTPANVASFIEVYKNIYHTTKPLIENSGSKAEVESIMNNLTFPTEAEIIASLS